MPTGIQDGQRVNQTNSNAAWLAKNGDDSTVGRIDLNNAQAVSGSSITNLQRNINSIFSFLGGLSNQIVAYFPTFTNNEGFTGANDTIFNRVNDVSAKFKLTTGHAHSGSAGDGAKISANSLLNVNLRGYLVRATDIAAPSGTTHNVTSLLTGKTVSNNQTTKGVVANAPYNEIVIKRLTGTEQDTHIEDAAGNIVFGRLTESAGTWTLSYLTDVAGVETAYTMLAGDTSAGLKWWFTELYHPLSEAPVYPEILFLPSDNYTQDVLDASASQSGKVNITAQSFAGAKTFTDTTQSTTKDTGSIILEGGLGVEKNIYAGGVVAATGAVSGSNLSGTNTGDLTLGAIGSTPSANGASLSGQVLTLQPASSTLGGILSAVAQSIKGLKTFIDGIDVNSNKITNVLAGSAALDAVNFTQLSTKIGNGLDSTAIDTILTVTSNTQQLKTGTTARVVTMPVVTTLPNVGWYVEIINDSTAKVTVNSSGGSNILTIRAGGRAFVICTALTGTTRASWTYMDLPPIIDYTSTVTAAGTTTLDFDSSTRLQLFTGTSAQSIAMPATTPVFYNLNYIGDQFEILNLSTNTLTVKANNTANICFILPMQKARLKVIGTGGITPADWYYEITTQSPFSNPMTSTVTAAGTTTLTAASTGQQFFTGSSTQIVALPVTSTLVLGQAFYIVNNSTGIVTVNSSGANLVKAIPAGGSLLVTCVLTSGTTAASWNADYKIANSTADDLTNKDIDGGTASNTSRITLPKAAKTTLDALTRKQGTIVHDTTGNKPYYDNGTTLVAFGSGSGSGGGKNYITTGDAETGTTGFATYADAAGTSPVDGTGGTAITTFTTSSTLPLADSNSFIYAKSALDRQGGGVSYDFTIDSKDKARVLQIGFEYLVDSGTFVAGTSSTASDVTVWIYDITNAVLIQPSSHKLLSNSLSIADRFSATFQTASNSTSYRLILHVGSTSTAAYGLKIDNISISPSSYVYGTPVTDWATYTPTYTGYGTISAGEAYWRRVGDSIQLRGRFTAGTTTAVSAAISLPSGFVISPTSLVTQSEFGTYVNNSSTANFAILAAPSGTAINFGSVSGGSGLSAAVGTTMATTGQVQGWHTLPIPITGWSSSVQTSDQTDIRVVNWVGAITTGTALTANVTNIPVVTDKDSHGSWSGTIYTVPVAGDYFINVTMQMTTSQTLAVVAYVNGSAAARCSNSYAFVISVGSCVLPNLKTGDQISFRSNTAVTTLANATEKFSITRISGPSAIAANESMNARYYASATSISGTLALINWTTKDYDSHGGMSAGSYTVQSPGKYHIDSAILIAGTIALNTTAIMEIQKNGTVVCRNTEYSGGAMTNQKAWVSDLISCITGDVLTIKVSSSATAPTIVSSNFDNYFSIFRAGN